MEKLIRRLFFVLAFPIFASTQTNSDQPFVTVSDKPGSVSNLTLKIYDTRLTIVHLNSTNDSAVNSTIFNQAANAVYSVWDGFLSTIIIDNPDLNGGSNSSSIRYQVQYLYNQLNASVNGSDDLIASTIGNVTYVSEILMQNSNFTQLYVVDANNFNFAGQSICGTDNCNSSVYVTCTENLAGVSIVCTSRCLSCSPPSGLCCYNGGFCFHNDSFQKPFCKCSSSYDAWFVGSRCESYLHLWMIIVFFVIVFIIIFIFIPLLTYYFIRTINSRLEKKQRKEDKKKLLAAAKEQEKMNKKEEKIVAAANNANSPADDEEHPVAAPRLNNLQAEALGTSADSFDDSSLPHSTERHPDLDNHESSPASNGNEISDFHAPIRSRSPPLEVTDQIPDSTSVSSTSSSEQTQSAEDTYISLEPLHPPIPYSEPPSYVNIRPNQGMYRPFLPNLKHVRKRQGPLVTTV